MLAGEETTGLAAAIRRQIFGISTSEADFDRRGFPVDNPGVRRRLEAVGHCFLRGYHEALERPVPGHLMARLELIASDFRGFAYEGAAMGLALLDFLTPWRKSRLSAFLQAGADRHIYMVYVGVGWALARLRRGPKRVLSRLDPLLCWLTIDGLGFHQGYFHWQSYVRREQLPKGLSGYAARAFDQGLGRSLWFVQAANGTRIGNCVQTFAEARQPDLWSGVGLACAYAGGMEREAIRAMQKASGPYRPCLAQGAAFAAKARERAGNPAPHTDAACQVLCGMSAREAAGITDSCLEGLPAGGATPPYELWRERIRGHFK